MAWTMIPRGYNQELVVTKINRIYNYIKPDQNKKGQKIFQLHRFLNTFLQLAAEKKYSKNGAAGNFFGPSYFVMALGSLPKMHQKFFKKDFTQLWCS